MSDLANLRSLTLTLKHPCGDKHHDQHSYLVLLAELPGGFGDLFGDRLEIAAV